MARHGDSADPLHVTGSLSGGSTAGDVAHDAVDSGNPVKIGGIARTVLVAVSAALDRVNASFDKFGRQLATVAPLDQRTSGTVNRTDNTAADVIAAPGASVAIVVTALIVTNAHATVGTKVSIRDDATVKIVGYAAAVGGGFILQDPNGLFVAAANAPIRAICGTTGADVDVSVSGYKIPA